MQRSAAEYLEYTAHRLPDKTALKDEKNSFSFSDVLKMARSIASEILRASAGPVFNCPVVVLAARNALSIIGIQAVLISGNYYVPLDPDMPKERFEKVLEKLNPAAVLYSEVNQRQAEYFGCRIPLISLEKAAGCEEDDDLIGASRARILDIDPAYIIFTSGSTGAPKGIAVSHRSLIDYVEWYTQACRISEEDVFGNQAPYYFDPSAKDIYGSMKMGASIHVLPKKFFSFPMLLLKYLDENGITNLNWSTSAFHLVANSGGLEKIAPHALKQIVVGGEALQARQLNIWRRALPDAEYINHYGPTEVTVDCCHYVVDRQFADDEAIPIGKSCCNKEVFLLDEQGRPVTKGSVGEICVRGSGVALGYFGEKEKTDAVFTQDPRNPYFPQLIYHTGDMAKENEDGDLIFLARKDNQVKHGGYRIELGEIETALNSLSFIENAVCIFDEQKDKIICVYTGSDGATPDNISKELRCKLSKYMLPNIYEKLDVFPMNANNKIDRPELKRRYIK